MVLTFETSFEKNINLRKGSYKMTEEISTTNDTILFPEIEEAQNAFREKYRFDLSDTELEGWEVSMKQPIKVTKEEKQNPQIILDFLETLKRK